MSLARTSPDPLCVALGTQPICPAAPAVRHTQSADHAPFNFFAAKMAFVMEVAADWKPIWQVLNMVSEGKDISVAVLKPQGYVRRFFSGESWTEWRRHRTDLGRVVRAFCDYTCDPNKSVQDYLEYFCIDSQTLTRASAQAQDYIDNPPKPTLSLLDRIHKATLFPMAAAKEPVQSERIKKMVGLLDKLDPINSIAFTIVQTSMEERVQEEIKRRTMQAYKARLNEWAKKYTLDNYNEILAGLNRGDDSLFLQQAQGIAHLKHFMKNFDWGSVSMQASFGGGGGVLGQFAGAIDDVIPSFDEIIPDLTDLRSQVAAEIKETERKLREGANDGVEYLREKGGQVAQGAKDLGETVAEAGKELDKARLKAFEDLTRELGKGFEAVDTGLKKLVEHTSDAMKGLYKIATGEHKLSIHSFDDARRKARKDYADEIARAPAPVKVLHETVRYMVEDDLEGTTILIASFAADAALPGSGQAIRVAYAAKKMHDSGMPPEVIAAQLAEGNAEQLVEIAVDAYAPQFSGAVKMASEAKHAYDTYKDNEDLIDAARKGDGRAMALLGQTLAVMTPEISDQLEKYGVRGQDLVRLQEGDPKAARNLITSGLRMTVDSIMKEEEVPLDFDAAEEEEILDDEELLEALKEGDEPETVTIEVEVDSDPIGDVGSAKDAEEVDVPGGIAGSFNTAELEKTGKKLVKAMAKKKFVDPAKDEALKRVNNKILSKRNQDLKAYRKRLKKFAKENGWSKNQLKAAWRDVKRTVKRKWKVLKAASKAAVHGVAAADNPVGAVIEFALTKGARVGAAAAAGIAELLISENTGTSPAQAALDKIGKCHETPDPDACRTKHYKTLCKVGYYTDC